jgi:predicted dinucleotide-binding enzyme
MKKIAIIGKGNVGSALERGLQRAEYDVRSTGKENVRETAAWGEVVILAVPFGAVKDAVQTMGDAVDGKVLVDATNALDENMGWPSASRPAARKSSRSSRRPRRSSKRSTPCSPSTWTAGESAARR